MEAVQQPVPQKTCFKCDQVKPLTEFYRHPETSDGRLNKCKDCTKNDVRENRKKKEHYYKAHDVKRNKTPERRKAIAVNYRRLRAQNPERFKQYQANYLIRNPQRRAAVLRQSRQRHGEKYFARNLVNNAIRDGRLERHPCEVCGLAESVHAHHDDYSKPLDVRWLCPKHHGEVHRIYE